MSCLFCRIVSGEIPATVVHETDDVLAFRDVSPQAPVHVLVIPKEHHANLADAVAASPDLVAKVAAGCAAVAEAEGLGGGYRIVTNTGPDGGQSVGHLHFHVLGGRRLAWPPG